VENIGGFTASYSELTTEYRVVYRAYRGPGQVTPIYHPTRLQLSGYCDPNVLNIVEFVPIDNSLLSSKTPHTQ